ncbi:MULTISPECIES: hypothetical protein [unclassified Streptomyces]|uniref:hypothetical protein n=1 Tax=unclassified Streptomyces TaxID=2593676 RepID=UPI0023653B10|nr:MULTISPECIES: hypothetical protein [unclassified Streptomyces]MDF3141942.1 hypothetical protein [Streptomyces sp. T21Q-yed]WDF40351.1 hypothetical protein PBV52_27995 [Streptomyces sp. T12]
MKITKVLLAGGSVTSVAVLTTLTTVTALTVLAAPAVAQESPGSAATRSGATVHVQARDNVVNGMRVGIDPRNGHLIVEDDAGIAAGQGCMPMSGTDGTAVDCGPATGMGGVTRLNVSMGNFGDSFFSTAPVNTSVDAGSGGDFVRTGAGNDSINLRDDVRGNDAVTCDSGGNDQVVGEAGDTITADCERQGRF